MTIWDVTDDKKNEVWNHFIERWAVGGDGGGHGVTGHRLRYIKPIIFHDDDFWYDIVHRHGLNELCPTDLVSGMYNHCSGNFWGSIYQSLVEHGKIKA